MNQEVLHGYTIETIIQVKEKSRVLQAYDGDDMVVLKTGTSHKYSEANILQKMSHPNIIPLLQSFQEPEMIVVPFIHGMHLADYLQYSSPNVKTATKIFSSLVSAVAHIHSKGFLHCDLNSPNILIDHSHTLTLIDFGLARPIQQAKLQRKIIGSTRSSPPELHEGGVWTEQGEIYSLGILLKDILDACNEDVPEYFEQILSKCINNNPKNRPQSAAELYKLIETHDEMLNTDTTIESTSSAKENESIEEDATISPILIALGIFALGIGISIGIILSS